MTAEASDIFDYYPDDRALDDLRKYAPMLFDDLYIFKKHWPTKTMMEECFSLAREFQFKYPYVIYPHLVCKGYIKSLSSGREATTGDVHSLCVQIGQVFAWLTHQRVYELSALKTEAILKGLRAGSLLLDTYQFLPEAGLYIEIPRIARLQPPEIIPSAIFASLDFSYRDPGSLWLFLRVDMRDKVTMFDIEIRNGSTKRIFTGEETLARCPEDRRLTLLACLLILQTLISPRLILRSQEDNVTLLPTNRDIHPAFDRSFSWPRRISRCSVGWRGISENPSEAEIKTIWTAKR